MFISRAQHRAYERGYLTLRISELIQLEHVVRSLEVFLLWFVQHAEEYLLLLVSTLLLLMSVDRSIETNEVLLVCLDVGLCRVL